NLEKNRWKREQPMPFMPSGPWRFPLKFPIPDIFKKPDPNENPYPRPWSTPEEVDEYYKRWERPEGEPDAEPEENPYDGPIWSPSGRADNPETCWTAIMYEDPKIKRDWGWIGFQFGGGCLAI
ncbi:MAG: hypothetical protein ACRC62_28950, partial [Microcoleus sp.]